MSQGMQVTYKNWKRQGTDLALELLGRKTQPHGHLILAQFDSYWASLIAQLVKNAPAMRETWVQSLGQEDPMKMEMATHFSSCLDNPTDRGAWQATVHGVASIGHDLATKPPPP